MTTRKVMQVLETWFDKPLEELPQLQRQIADEFNPNWDELSPSERRARSVDIDQQQAIYKHAWGLYVERDTFSDSNPRGLPSEIKTSADEIRRIDLELLQGPAHVPSLTAAPPAAATLESPDFTPPKSTHSIVKVQDQPGTLQVQVAQKNWTSVYLTNFNFFPQSEVTATPLRDTAESATMTAGESPVAEQLKPISKVVAQDAAILAEIRHLGHDPLKLPKPAAGKAGMKAVVRKNLTVTNKESFISARVFDDAWQRLRDQGEICDGPTLSPELSR